MPKKTSECETSECETCALVDKCQPFKITAPREFIAYMIMFPGPSGNCLYYTPKQDPPERRAVLRERMMNHGNK